MAEEIYDDMPELEDNSGTQNDEILALIDKKVFGGEKEDNETSVGYIIRYNPNNPDLLQSSIKKAQIVVMNIASMLYQTTKDKDDKRMFLSYLYPVIINVYQHYRDFTIFLLIRGYTIYAHVVGLAVGCWDLSLFVEVFVEFMYSDSSEENNKELLERLFELGINDPISLDFYPQEKREKVSQIYKQWKIKNQPRKLYIIPPCIDSRLISGFGNLTT